MGRHKLSTDRQTKSDTAHGIKSDRALVRTEGLADLLRHFRRHAPSIILHGDMDDAARVAIEEARPQMNVAVWRVLASIAEQVDDDPLNSIRVTPQHDVVIKVEVYHPAIALSERPDDGRSLFARAVHIDLAPLPPSLTAIQPS